MKNINTNKMTLRDICKSRDLNHYKLIDAWNTKIYDLEVFGISTTFREKKNIIQKGEMFCFEKDGYKFYKKYYANRFKFKIIKKVGDYEYVRFIKVEKVRILPYEESIFNTLKGCLGI